MENPAMCHVLRSVLPRSARVLLVLPEVAAKLLAPAVKGAGIKR